MDGKHFRIFVGSPGDVVAERDSLNTVVNELSRTCNALLPSTGIVLELVRWETHAYPSMGRPQGVINEQVGEYDVFIGILWKRFGTPTGQAESGTAEEFRIAFKRWKKTKRPHILLYFNTAPISPPRSSADIRQLSLVADFRTEVEKEGLVWEYSGADTFADTVRPHLTELIGGLVNPREQLIVRPSRGERKMEESSVLAGNLVRIIDIGEDDAWYDKKDDLIGSTARIVEAKELRDGWYSGTVLLDPQPQRDIPERVFARFKFDRGAK